MRKLGPPILAAFLVLGGCASYRDDSPSVRDLVQRNDHAGALGALEAADLHPQRDLALYQLNRGSLLRLGGQFEQSNIAFEEAKQEMERLFGVSVSEQAGAMLINDAVRAYAGDPHERLLVHLYKALNSLSLGDLESARIEMLQADTRLQAEEQLEDASGGRALMRYMSGLVFELNNEHDNALIAYHLAYEELSRLSLPIPLALSEALQRTSRREGRSDDYQIYVEQFGALSGAESLAPGYGELALIIGVGLVDGKRENIIWHFSDDGKQRVHIAIPSYPPKRHPAWQMRARAGTQKVEMELIEDVDLSAREALDEDMPAIIARTVVRAIAKDSAQHEAEKKGSVAGFVALLTGIVTERADTRSWDTLPRRFYIGRLALPAGEHNVVLEWSEEGNLLGSKVFEKLNVKAGRLAVHGAHWTAAAGGVR